MAAIHAVATERDPPGVMVGRGVSPSRGRRAAVERRPYPREGGRVVGGRLGGTPLPTGRLRGTRDHHRLNPAIAPFYCEEA